VILCALVKGKRLSKTSAGLFFTMLGMQSGAHEIRRDIYELKLPKDRVIEFVNTLEKLGIQFTHHFIYLNPFEHEHHLEESFSRSVSMA
jgi:hypothetical protein